MQTWEGRLRRSAAAVIVAAAMVALAACGGTDSSSTPTTSLPDGRPSTTGPRPSPAAAAAERLFPPAPTAAEARVVSADCQANLDAGAMAGMDMAGMDHGSEVDAVPTMDPDSPDVVTPADTRFEARRAADGTYERVYGGVNPRTEVSRLPFDTPPTDDERRAAGTFVEQVRASIAAHGWDDPAKAASDGYRPMQRCNSHWVNVAAVLDGRDLDPEHPEFLVIEPGRDGKQHFHSVMFATASNAAHGPQPFGTLAIWHYHDGATCLIDGILSVSQSGSTCPAGSARYPRSPEMLHVRTTGTPFSPAM